MFSRHRNAIFLTVVLLAELLVLAYQVHKKRDIPLLRQVSILTIMPVEKGIRTVSGGVWNIWKNYIDLRGARRQNEELVRELNDIKLDNQRLGTEAEQGRRLQALLDFKGQSRSETVAAQVISSGGNETARLVLLDKGYEAGLRPDMAVIVPDGIVGKVLRVFPHAAQVLLLTDPNSGVGCILESSRIHGVLKGQNKPLLNLNYILNDEMVQIGEKVFTSGEDRVYPKGMPIGVVVEAHPGSNFQEISVQPFAKLNRLEEVLVVTRKVDTELAGVPPQPLVGPPAPARPAPPNPSAPLNQPGSAALMTRPEPRPEQGPR